MKVNSLFVNPIFEIETDFDLEQLKKDILEEKKIDEGITRSNVSGWHSNNILDNQKFFNLTEKITSIASEEFVQVLDKNRILKLNNCWFNVNSKGAYNQSHVHPMSVLSGVLFVDAEKSSPIIFQNTNYYSQFYLDSCLDEKFKINFGILLDASYFPVNGTMLIFPSYLHHSVGQNIQDKDRISISFNFNILELLDD